MFGYRSVKVFSEIALILGREEESARYAEYAERMKGAIRRRVLAEDHPYGDYVGRYVLAIAWDIAEGETYEMCRERLVKLVEEADCRIGTGFLATPYLLDTLDKIGRHDLAVKVLRNEACPGWLHEVKMGGTTIWEEWDAMKDDGLPQKISYDHYAFGVVDDYIFRKIVGITSLEPGFRKVKIEPDLSFGLGPFRRTFICEAGEISVDWNGEHLSVQVPPNVEAV